MMQQQYPPQGSRFAPVQQQPTVHRFPQNNPAQAYEQQGWQQPAPQQDRCADCPHFKEASKHRRRKKFSFVWTIFALIGLITVGVQAFRYLILPLLVYLNILSGGTL